MLEAKFLKKDSPVCYRKSFLYERYDHKRLMRKINLNQCEQIYFGKCTILGLQRIKHLCSISTPFNCTLMTVKIHEKFNICHQKELAFPL